MSRFGDAVRVRSNALRGMAMNNLRKKFEKFDDWVVRIIWGGAPVGDIGLDVSYGILLAWSEDFKSWQLTYRSDFFGHVFALSRQQLLCRGLLR